MYSRRRQTKSCTTWNLNHKSEKRFCFGSISNALRFALEVLVASRHRKYSSVSVRSTTQHFPKLTWKYRILSDSHVAHRAHISLDRRENRCQIVHTLIIVSFCPKYTCISRTKTILSVLAVALQQTPLSLTNTHTHIDLTVNNTFNSWKFCAHNENGTLMNLTCLYCRKFSAVPKYYRISIIHLRSLCMCCDCVCVCWCWKCARCRQYPKRNCWRKEKTVSTKRKHMAAACHIVATTKRH